MTKNLIFTILAVTLMMALNLHTSIELEHRENQIESNNNLIDSLTNQNDSLMYLTDSLTSRLRSGILVFKKRLNILSML